MYNGSIVALVTPMHSSGEIDYESFKRLILWHIKSQTQAIVVNGTTGESATLSFEEKVRLLKTAVETADNKIPILAGTGSCSTTQTIKEIQAAASCNVAACLVVTPYYNRPTQEGLYQHYQAIAQSVDIPIITYNVPTRTGCDLLPKTMARLANVPNIIGIKEATGDVNRVIEYKNLVNDRFLLLSGDDESALEFMRLGGNGVVSVCANIVPALFQQMCDLVLQQNYSKAQEINCSLQALYASTMLETNPIPTKWALHKLGKIPAGIRLPLTTLSNAMQEKVSNVLDQLFEQSIGVIGQT